MNSAPGAPVLQCIIMWSSIFSQSPSKNMDARVIKQTRESFARFFALRRSSVPCEVSSSSFLHHFTANAQKIQRAVGLTMSLITLGWIVSWILFSCACVYSRMSTAVGNMHRVQYCKTAAELISGWSMNCLYVVDISSFPTSASSVLHGGR